MGADLAALQVVGPLLGAPLCALFGRGFRGWAISTLFTWAAFACSIALLLQVVFHPAARRSSIKAKPVTKNRARLLAFPSLLFLH